MDLEKTVFMSPGYSAETNPYSVKRAGFWDGAKEFGSEFMDQAREQKYNPAGWFVKGLGDLSDGSGEFTRGAIEMDGDKMWSGAKDMGSGLLGASTPMGGSVVTRGAGAGTKGIYNFARGLFGRSGSRALKGEAVLGEAARGASQAVRETASGASKAWGGARSAAAGAGKVYGAGKKAVKPLEKPLDYLTDPLGSLYRSKQIASGKGGNWFSRAMDSRWMKPVDTLGRAAADPKSLKGGWLSRFVKNRGALGLSSATSGETLSRATGFGQPIVGTERIDDFESNLENPMPRWKRWAGSALDSAMIYPFRNVGTVGGVLANDYIGRKINENPRVTNAARPYGGTGHSLMALTEPKTSVPYDGSAWEGVSGRAPEIFQSGTLTAHGRPYKLEKSVVPQLYGRNTYKIMDNYANPWVREYGGEGLEPNTVDAYRGWIQSND